MIRVLVLGGTRFIGKSLALNLLQEDVEMYVSSRRRLEALSNQYQFTCERSDLAKLLNDLRVFDYVLDFNGYSADSIEQLPKGSPKINYIAISTIWVGSSIRDAKRFSALYRDHDCLYAERKRQYELAAMRRFREKCSILRLPIVLGETDHHNRIQFLLRRILNNSKLLTSSVEESLTFITEPDLIGEIKEYVLSSNRMPRMSKILYSESLNHKNLVRLVSSQLGQEPELLAIKPEILMGKNPRFLENEALMREIRFEDNLPNINSSATSAENSLMNLIATVSKVSKPRMTLSPEQELLLSWESMH